MDVSRIPSSPTAPPSAAASQALGTKENFLRLLIAQLEHQNPLSPLEGADFTAQLAQFTTLEQLEAMNTRIGTLVDTQEAATNVQAAALIGKEVRAVGNTVRLQPGEPVALHYKLPADSAKVTISIFDASGAPVQKLERGRQPAGEHTVSWQGRDARGVTLPAGEYTFTVTAEDATGAPVAVDTLINGRVEGVEFTENGTFLRVGGNRVALTALTSVNVTQ